ncbi:MAG: hypothetical protein WAW37_18330 [Syntrophobacteraceae bacterium]
MSFPGCSESRRFKKTCLFFTLFATILACGGFETLAHSGGAKLHHNQVIIDSLDREIAQCGGERYLAVLRGLRWCVVLFDDNSKFDCTFSNYLMMLDELTLYRPYPALADIVHTLIVREFERALPRFRAIFPPDTDGYDDFIRILPVAYRHQAPIKPLKEFAARHFAGVTPIDRLPEFRRAAKKRDYSSLTGLLVSATSLNMAYRCQAEKDFALPPDHYQTIVAECASIPFTARFNQDAYSSQNYYATHVVLALNHYSQHPLIASATADKVFFYLAANYDTVRHRVGDFDLLCEYLYSFRQFGLEGVQFVSEGERYVLSQQREDGSWGTEEDFESDPYDQFHPTWTAVTLLILGTG